MNKGKLFRSKHEKAVLYGNVDDRQINLSFQYAERIAEILKEEGEIVKKGDILAKLETERIRSRSFLTMWTAQIRMIILRSCFMPGRSSRRIPGEWQR